MSYASHVARCWWCKLALGVLAGVALLTAYRFGYGRGAQDWGEANVPCSAMLVVSRDASTKYRGIASECIEALEACKRDCQALDERLEMSPLLVAP